MLQSFTPSQSDETSPPRPHIRGKFIYVGKQKFYARGVTYGTFRPDENGGEQFTPEQVERDFALMAENGVNTVRTYTVPPRWLLDTAQRHGLRVMVGMPWEQHITFLDDAKLAQNILERVRQSARICAGHPALLCFTIGNEIPTQIVRWYGRSRIERFLKQLYQVIKAVDEAALVTYVNYPSTEYLQLPFLDFCCFNVYLESEEKLSAYLARLQNLAGDRPLVMAEIGLDSRRNGEEQQALTLAWQVRTVFAAGCAGAFVFAWTDEWWRGGFDIEDWDFGLTRRDRSPKPALAAVRQAFAEIPFPADSPWPRISVVVCTYNGARTIQDCLDGLMELDYPNFETIVVNDGSTDDTAHIVSQYPVRLLSTSNHGLSNARNTGMEAATGEIIAYTDDDARPDPQWLRYLAWTFMTGNYAGVGGPNIAPPGDGWIADCVANAPGGPVHVLLSDTEAEHLPGCNMAFRRDVLQAIKGCDPRYRTAGDDVDLCWRVQQYGGKLGFSPAAMVWHHRRNSLKMYWKQQQGYGRAEALLEAKWPEKYNAAGHLNWTGRLYGKGLTQTLLNTKARIYHGTWGSGLFQSLYQPAQYHLGSLPLMPEWNLLLAVLPIFSMLGVAWKPLLLTLPLFLSAVGLVIGQAAKSAAQASFTSPSCTTHSSWLKLWGMTTVLHLLQPIARLKGRLQYGLTMWRKRGIQGFSLPRSQTISIWSERWHSSEERLERLEKMLSEAGGCVFRGGDFEAWDLEIRGGLLGGARLSLAVEEHGGNKQYARFRCGPNFSRFGLSTMMLLIGLIVAALLSGSNGGRIVALVLGMGALLLGSRKLYETGAALATLQVMLRRLSMEPQTESIQIPTIREVGVASPIAAIAPSRAVSSVGSSLFLHHLEIEHLDIEKRQVTSGD